MKGIRSGVRQLATSCWYVTRASLATDYVIFWQVLIKIKC